MSAMRISPMPSPKINSLLSQGAMFLFEKDKSPIIWSTDISKNWPPVKP